jgi:hypothetical protein
VDYDVETTTHTEEDVTLFVVYNDETTTATLSVVNNVETTTHTEEDVTQSVGNDAETTTHTKEAVT